jgi:hypothetical protein
MHDIGGRIIYVDMQKTGSTRASDFLNKCSVLRIRRFAKHQVLTQDYVTPGAFYFTTVRNPFDLYVSCFRFGCDGPDAIRLWMEAKGLEGLERMYQPTNDAFNAWIEFILDPANARYIGDGFPLVSRHGIGIMSYRHLIYSIRHPSKVLLNDIHSSADFEKLYLDESVMDLVIRNEELDEELRKLATERLPELFDEAFIDLYFERRKPRLNETRTGKAEDFTFSDATRALVREREDFLIRRFYPELAN